MAPSIDGRHLSEREPEPGGPRGAVVGDGPDRHHHEGGQPPGHSGSTVSARSHPRHTSLPSARRPNGESAEIIRLYGVKASNTGQPGLPPGVGHRRHEASGVAQGGPAQVDRLTRSWG